MTKNTRHTFVLLLLFAGAIFGFRAHAQQLDCSVQVNYEGVATTDKEHLSNFAADVGEYMNNYQWGSDNLPQKVKCTLSIFIQSVIGENRYQAQAFIGSQRPVFNSERSSAVTRFLDQAWTFTYVKSRPMNHNPDSYSDLASFLDFYAYIILGYDYDTYERLGGSPFFQKASDVASLGRSSGDKGWELTTATFSRTQLVNELLNVQFEPVRTASYFYHFTGLDSLASDPVRAYSNILTALEHIGKARKQSDPRNIVIKAFFEAKHLEIADLFQQYPDRSVYVELGAIDPSHLKTYEEYRTKSQ